MKNAKRDDWSPAQSAALRVLLEEVRRTQTPASLQAIADALGLSKMRVCQIEKAIILKIRAELAVRGVDI